MRLASLIAVAGLLASPPVHASDKAGQVTPALLQASLDDAIARGAPGLSVAIGTRDGVVWTGVAGNADVSKRVPVRRDDAFGIGSITKVFVAVVALQLVEEGKLSLNATPASVLGVQAVRGIANADVASVEQLLAHTSGIASWEDDPHWIRAGRGDAVVPAHRWSRTGTLDYIRGKPATGAPGAAFSYSNTNFTLLGMMIEAVTRHSAAAAIRTRILRPLGLRHSWLEGFETPRGPVARRYHYATATFRKDAGISPAFPEVRPGMIDVSASNLSVEWTAGGMVSTSADLVRFATALRDGRLLKPESLALMEAWGPARRASAMGHSLFRFFRTAEPLIGHNGSVLGFTGSLVWAERGDAVIAVLSNVGTMHAGEGLPPAAYDVGLYSPFTELALRFARQHRSR